MATHHTNRSEFHFHKGSANDHIVVVCSKRFLNNPKVDTSAVVGALQALGYKIIPLTNAPTVRNDTSPTGDAKKLKLLFSRQMNLRTRKQYGNPSSLGFRSSSLRNKEKKQS